MNQSISWVLQEHRVKEDHKEQEEKLVFKDQQVKEENLDHKVRRELLVLMDNLANQEAPVALEHLVQVDRKDNLVREEK